MSVSVPNRKHSECQYLYDLYLLAIRIGEIVANKPDKYVKIYGEYLVQQSLEALKYGQLADRIDLSRDYTVQDYENKEEYLKRAYGLIDVISTASYIFLLQSSKSPNVKDEKIAKENKDIGTLCNNCHNELLRVLEEEFGFIDKKF